ncbi:TonB-dependent receptor [Bathymodiolus platifrons methanotrophic gill symbiont]|uniref:TonB-dependent receptor n=1 Tax=Bathymodiolus platifrons methanotrophic gill symbiont TaxID=113268 RepID=UPI000B40AA0B|nr:TonB-dependent receptor [Bathymodiolus platifrons methanotrophic gill symbiont]
MNFRIVHYGVMLFCITTTAQAEEQQIEEQTEVEQPIELEALSIVNATPFGAGIEMDKVITNVQVMTAEDMAKSQSISIADYMNQYMGSVSVNDAQNNPMQPDIQYRGFTISPLMGLPQGLSVYTNGIRFNEPFGDSVHWDLIPKGAIDSMSLQGGSNPAYGLNSLGGAIAIKTKTGFTAPEHSLTLSGGSWARHNEELTSGWNNDKFAYFLDLQYFHEDGWRDHSESGVFNGLGTLSWRTDDGQLNLTLAGANSSLIGNGAIPVELEAIDRKAVFTHPDKTSNHFFLSALDGNLWLNDATELAGNMYYRSNRIDSLNGDGSEFEECENMPVFLCEEGEDEIVEDVYGNPVQATDEVEGGTLNTSETDQWSFGLAFQSAFNQSLWGHDNQFVIGTSYDLSQIAYSADTELGSLTDERGVNGSGILVDESRVRLDTTNHSFGLFFTEVFNVTDKLAVNVVGRYNHVEIDMQDGYGTSLTGKHKFDRFNPAAGLTYAFMPELNFYGGYSESSRVPTPMELSCADPDDPCKLPNAFIADPPLDQVVAKSWEVGFRGNFSNILEGRVKWNLGYFNTVNHDDIIFQSAGTANSAGYFDNVGRTQRQGVELGLSSSFFDRWRMALNYSYINAVFLTAYTAHSPSNPHEDESGDIQVESGSHIPGIPQHIVKFSSDVDIVASWTFGFNVLFNAEQFLRGDEANLDTPLGSFAVVNLKTEYRFNKHCTIFGRLDNLFNNKYNNFGMYGETGDVLEGIGVADKDTRFVGVSAPRAGWVGVKLSL